MDSATLIDRKPPKDILASSLYYSGYAHLRLQKPDEAAKAFRRVVNEFPESPFFSFACVSLAEVYAKKQQPSQEIAELYRKVTRSPATPRVGAESWFQLGQLAFKDKDYAKASEAFEQLLMRYPQDERAAQGRLQAAWSFFHSKRAADALKIAEGALPRAAEEQRAEWYYLIANAQRVLGQHQEARKSYEQVLRSPGREDLARSAAYEQALLAFEDKDYAAVLQLLGNLEPAPEIASDVLWLVAESHAALNQGDLAIAKFKALAEQFPGTERAVNADFQRARLLQESKQWNAASDLYRGVAKSGQAGELAPRALQASAYCREQAGQKEEALQDLAQLAEKHAGFAGMDDVLYQKALREMELGRDEPARATLDRLLKEFPKGKMAGEGHYLRGILMERSGDFEISEFHYRSALLFKPDARREADIQFRRAAVLQRQGKNAEAAAIIHALLSGNAVLEIPAPLLEWVARWNLENGKFAEADLAATRLAGYGQGCRLATDCLVHGRPEPPGARSSGRRHGGLWQVHCHRGRDARRCGSRTIPR
jgi:TolA-binding protein